jgi:hypothetical protein
MNIIQTLYINSGTDPLSNSFGWVAPEYHIMSWALSCLQLRKLYPVVDLHANSSAAKLLIDTLGLPYSNVHLTHDQLTLVDPRLWALPKIHTYSLQQDPFLHVDGDVFLFNKFDECLLNSELIAQNIEQATSYYLSTQKQLIEHFNYFPKCVKADFESGIPIRAVNAGILGGNNVGFINEYANEVFTYINKNSNKLKYVNIDLFNVFFEQHLFYSLAKERHLSISPLFTDIINDNEYKYLGNFHEVPYIRSYLHLIGHFKKDLNTCIQLAMTLRDLYPDYYYRIVALFQQKDKPFFIKYGDHKQLNIAKKYITLHEQAHRRYQIVEILLASRNSSTVSTTTSFNLNLSSFTEIAQTVVHKVEDSLIQTAIMHDYYRFVGDLNIYLRNATQIDFEFLYGRDLAAVTWYSRLFAPMSDSLNQIVIRCPEIAVIVSDFDWSRLVNSYKRAGIQHYEIVEPEQGLYFNLVVPEVYQDCLSFFDIDELEKMILDHLTIPTSINVLLKAMRSYADEDVLQQHQALFDNFILTLVKQLVIKKAIKPID